MLQTIHRGAWALLLCLFSLGAFAADYDDAAALAGVKDGKGVFLLDFDNPQKLAFYLRIIKGSHEGLKRQGVEPEFVVVVIGPTVKYLNQEPDDEVAMRFETELAQVAEAVTALKATGTRLEICNIANEVFGLDSETVLPELDVVGDGFISLIGWQAQGFHLVPVF